jgi:transcriptional regulator with GAF, ATPase, and Fis domain
VGEKKGVTGAWRELDAALAHAIARGDGANAVRADLQPFVDELIREATRSEGEARLGRLALELASRFARAGGPREFASAALDAIASDLRAERAWVVTISPGGDEASLLAERRAGQPADATGLPLSRSLLAQLVRDRAPVLVEDAREGDHGTETSIVQLGLRSTLIAPLLHDERVTGAIGLENATLAGAFTPSDRDALEGVARLLEPYLLAELRLDDAIEEQARLDAVARGASHYRDLVGESAPMRALFATIERLATSDAPVLVVGESGTGKELIARALHYSSRRRQGRLVAVNCAAIPEGLMESELFGHERGAFTGATERRKGKLELASGGTIFLDEVGELRLDLQAKLLRALQEKAFERVGGSETLKADVRVIAATHRDLAKMVQEGAFREDLYWRLHVVPLAVPPLRDRPEDVAPLARHFLDELSRDAGRAMSFGPGVLERLRAHPFRGNVRELRNLVQRLVALSPHDVVGLEDLPEPFSSPPSGTPASGGAGGTGTGMGTGTVSLDKDPLKRFLKREPQDGAGMKALRAEMQDTLDTYLRRAEERFYRSLLERTGGNVSEAARVAGLNRTAMHRKLNELGIE